ncbi:MAG: hypothetical protein IJF22_03070 [Clostridia bacterium]|nr:hypothetical protein [Clostridia bacterium]
MTKKAKLASSIVVALFVAVMIPVAIFAASNQTVGISNYVQFFVEDLEGKFYYAITGNRLDKNSTTSSMDVGYDPISKTITPQLLFKAEYSTDDDDYFVYNGTGGIVLDQSIPVPQTAGIEFDENHQEINYYFVFINEAKSSETNPRSVYVTTKAEHSLNPNHVDTYWSYIIKTTGHSSELTPLKTTGIWTNSIEQPTIFETGIEVPPQDRALYSYIILKYTLKLQPTNIEFKNDLNLTITLKSAEI